MPDFSDEGDDNTILWIVLGAAFMWFLMRRQGQGQAPGVPQLPTSRKTGTPGVTQNADGSLTVTEPPLPEISVPSYSPGGTVAIPGESYGVANPFGLPPDDFTQINQG